MFCPECGSEISEGMKFCGNCGAKLIHIEELQEEPETTLLREELQGEPETTLLREEPQEEPVTTLLRDEPWSEAETTLLHNEPQIEPRFQRDMSGDRTDAGSGKTGQKGRSLSKVLIGAAAAVAVVLVVVLGLKYLPGTSSADSSGDAGGGLLSSLLQGDTPVSIKNYIVGESGEEELYYTASYYSDGTMEESWFDCVVYYAAAGIDYQFDSFTQRWTYTEDGNALKSEYLSTYTYDTDDGQTQTDERESVYTYSYEYDEQGNPDSCSVECSVNGETGWTVNLAITYNDAGVLQYFDVTCTDDTIGTASAFLLFTFANDGSLTSLSIADGDYDTPDEIEAYDTTVSFAYDADGNLTEASSSETYEGGMLSWINTVLYTLGDTRDCAVYTNNLLVTDYDKITITYDDNGMMSAAYAYTGTEESEYMTVPNYEETTDDHGRVVKRISWYDADSWEDADFYLVSYIEYE